MFKSSLYSGQHRLLAPPDESMVLDHSSLDLLNQNNEIPFQSLETLPRSIALADPGPEFICASCLPRKDTETRIWNHVLDHAIQFKGFIEEALNRSDPFRNCLSMKQPNFMFHYFETISLKKMMHLTGRSLLISLLVLSFRTRGICFEWFRSLNEVRDRFHFSRAFRSRGREALRSFNELAILKDESLRGYHTFNSRHGILLNYQQSNPSVYQHGERSNDISSLTHESIKQNTIMKFIDPTNVQPGKGLETAVTTKPVPERIVDFIDFCFDDNDSFMNELWDLRDETERQVNEFEKVAGQSQTLYCT